MSHITARKGKKHYTIHLGLNGVIEASMMEQMLQWCNRGFNGVIEASMME